MHQDFAFIGLIVHNFNHSQKLVDCVKVSKIDGMLSDYNSTELF